MFGVNSNWRFSACDSVCSRLRVRPTGKRQKNGVFKKFEDHPEFWDTGVLCRNPLAFAQLGCQQLSSLATRLEVSLKELISGH